MAGEKEITESPLAEELTLNNHMIFEGVPFGPATIDTSNACLRDRVGNLIEHQDLYVSYDEQLSLRIHAKTASSEWIRDFEDVEIKLQLNSDTSAQLDCLAVSWKLSAEGISWAELIPKREPIVLGKLQRMEQITGVISNGPELFIPRSTSLARPGKDL